MKKRIVLYLLILSLMLLLVSCMQVSTNSNPKNDVSQKNEALNNPQKGILINTQNTNLAQQDIFDNKVVWSGGHIRNKSKNAMHLLDTVYYYDLKTEKIVKIASTSKNGQTDETQVNNNWICWSDWYDPNGSDWTIYAYSFSENKIYEIDSSKNDLRPEFSQLPRLSLSNNSYLVWISEKLDENNEVLKILYLYNLSNKSKKAIAEIDNPKAIPFVSEKYVIWNSEREIHIYSIEEDEIIQKIHTSEETNFPKVNTEFVTWQEGDSLYIQQLNGGKKELVYNGPIFFYGIGQNHIVFQSGESIYAYNIANKSRFKLNDKDAILPYIRNKDIIWQELQDGMTNLRVVHIEG